MNFTPEQMINTFLIFMICLAVFAVIRELICWYFKINKRVDLQEKSIKNQDQIIILMKVGNSYLAEQHAEILFNHKGDKL